MGEGRNAENSAGEYKQREKVGKKNEQRKSASVEKEQGIARGETENCSWSALGQ